MSSYNVGHVDGGTQYFQLMDGAGGVLGSSAAKPFYISYPNSIPTGTTITVKDTLFTLQDDGDTTKQAVFQCSGISTGTTRTYTFPDVSSTIATLAAQTFTGAQTFGAFVDITAGGLRVAGTETAGAAGAGAGQAHITLAGQSVGTAALDYYLNATKAGAIAFDPSVGTIAGVAAAQSDMKIVVNAAYIGFFDASDSGRLVLGGGAALGAKTSIYNSIATAGWGAPAVYGSGRATAQTAANASVATYTVGVADGSFTISANVLVTASTTHSFSVECAYTDEGGTARTVTFNVQQLGGTLVTAITNITGAGPYEGVPLQIRAKAATAITIRTQAAGTYTSVTYNVEGSITQIA